MQAEAIYDGYMGNLVDNSSYQVDEYYKAYVESQDDTQENHTIRYYKDYFNEKNSNFYFEVVPDDAKKYPTLSNYKAEEYQYHDVRSRRIMTYTGQRRSPVSFLWRISLISGRTIMYRTNMMRITAAMKRRNCIATPGKFLCQSVTCTGIGAIFPCGYDRG